MTNFFRYRPVISGFIGGPGINTWHGEESVLGFDNEDPQAFATAVRACYDAWKSIYAPGVQITFPGEVTWHFEETGELAAVFPVDEPDPVDSTGAANLGAESRATQLVARLTTDVVRNGRRLQGRHFLGPINAGQLGQDGQAGSGVRATIAGGYGGLIDAPGPNLVVWGPPILDSDDGTVLHEGKKGLVKAVTVLTTPGTLRSRKT